MTINNLTYRSSITTSAIKRGLSGLETGIKNSQKSSNSISKSLLKRNDQKRQAMSVKSSLFLKRREAVRRREQEDIVEASSVSGSVRRSQRVIMNSTKGFMGRILDYIGTLLVGWALINLPTIISFAKELGTRIQKLTGILSTFMSDTKDFMMGFGQLLGGVFQNVISFDFTDSQGRLSGALNEMRQSFERMENSIYAAIDILTEPIDFGIPDNADDIIKDDDSSSEQPSGQPEPPGSSGAAGKWKPILDLIGSAEGGYESVNYGSGPGKIPGLTKMTVREAFNATEAYRKKYGGTGAMGKYQIVDSPLSRAKSAGLNIDKDLFSPENQDKIGVYLIEKERKITSDLIKNNPTEAAMKLSQLFAGIPVLAPTYSRYARRTVKRGESFYQGFNGNKATVTADAVEAAFKKFGSAPDSSSTPSSRPSPGQFTPIRKGQDLKAMTGAKNVDYVTASSPYGMRRDPFSGEQRLHGGIDISAPAGTYIALKIDSEVVFAGWQDPNNKSVGYGQVIDLWVEELGVQLRFGHCQGFLITSGKVKAGRSFARVGSTGRSTGPHIHFEYDTKKNRGDYGGVGDPSAYVPYILLTNTSNTSSVNPPANTSQAQLTSANIESAESKERKLKAETKDNIITVPLPSSQQRNTPMPLSGGQPGMDMMIDDSLNRFMIQKLLLDLAYT